MLPAPSQAFTFFLPGNATPSRHSSSPFRSQRGTRSSRSQALPLAAQCPLYVPSAEVTALAFSVPTSCPDTEAKQGGDQTLRTQHRGWLRSEVRGGEKETPTKEHPQGGKISKDGEEEREMMTNLLVNRMNFGFKGQTLPQQPSFDNLLLFGKLSKDHPLMRTVPRG